MAFNDLSRGFWRTSLQNVGCAAVAVLLVKQILDTTEFSIYEYLFRIHRGGDGDSRRDGGTSGSSNGISISSSGSGSGVSGQGQVRKAGTVHRSSSGDFRYVVEEETGNSLGKLTASPGLCIDPRTRGGPRAQTQLGLDEPLVIATCGLPARGKSYLVKMLMRYLRWTGYDCEVFNVGSLRRAKGMAGIDSSFFDATNQTSKYIREKMANEVQDVMYEWIRAETDGNPRIAIFDATNTTRARRLAVASRAREMKTGLLFVESICNDQQVLSKNYDMKLQNDDYKGMDPIVARKDFQERVAAYERVYETIGDDEVDGQISYIQLINVGQKVITRNCSGYISSQISFYLQQVHIGERKIYLTLTAESTEDALLTQRANAESLLVGESAPLSRAGNDYAEKLGKYMETFETSSHLLILSGTQNVHAEMILHLRPNFSCYSTSLLNELRGGDLHGLSSAQIKARFPEEHAKRERDLLNYRFPGFGGESYLDVIERAKPVIIELERQRRSVVICANAAVIRVIYGYFMGSKLESIPHLPFKPHMLYVMNPSNPFSTSVTEVRL